MQGMRWQIDYENPNGSGHHTPDAGKSTIVCALARIWKRQGRKAVPFKSQNFVYKEMG